MTILALDLGNKFGWATKQKTIISGWERLTKGKCDPGKKFVLFNHWLQEWNDKKITDIYYEDVVRHCSRDNARAYCGYLSVLQSYAYKNNIQCIGAGVKQIKKFATGNGNATKQDMIDAAVQAGFDVQDDNQADAIHLLRYAISIKG